ncbi:MAG: SRPBCC family protein [Saprospiraceae bacterium]|nr:SRPBCC family protein [Saprospiraceae bacterium]
MPKMHIDRKIEINAPAEKVRNVLADFHHWQAWSPWLITDPKARVKVRGDGKYYSWEGPRTGDGNMTITGESDERIEYDLVFLKPWKSKAKVAFEISPKGEATIVSWLMDSSLPFFMFWMVKSMTAYVSSDYDRGLAMLKEYIEEGNIASKLHFLGESSFEGLQYLGYRTECSMDNMDKAMTADFERLQAYAEAHLDNVAAPPFSIYHTWDMVNRKSVYTAALPVHTIPSSLGNMIHGSIPPTKVMTVQHVGSYKHLGNAWATLYMMQRGKEFKSVKQIHPFETYENMPGQVPEAELVTNVHFAIR